MLAAGLVLTLLQWMLEQTAIAGWLTGALARSLVAGAAAGLGVPARLEGLVIAAGGVQQPVTPTCLGLIAATAYLSALLATPARWSERWRGIRRDLPLLAAANLLRLFVLGAALAVSATAFHVAHEILLRAVAPLAVMALWGFWLTRDLRKLPRYPSRFLGMVALLLLPATGLWWLLLRPYLATLVAVFRVTLAGVLRLPIERAGLVAEGLRRFLDLTLPDGGLRLEVAARSLSLAPYFALVAASPVPWVRRLALGALGLASMLVLQAAEGTGLILLGRAAPGLISPAEALSDFLTVATAPVLWFLLAAPSRDWWPSGSPGGARSPRR